MERGARLAFRGRIWSRRFVSSRFSRGKPGSFDSPWGYLNSRILRNRGGYGCFFFHLLPFAALCVHVRRRI